MNAEVNYIKSLLFWTIIIVQFRGGISKQYVDMCNLINFNFRLFDKWMVKIK